MPLAFRYRTLLMLTALLGLSLSGSGCVWCCADKSGLPGVGQIPSELHKTAMPLYRIEPSDELSIDAIRVVPLPPYKLEPFDTIVIQVPDALDKEPISGLFTIEPEGTVNLGLAYGQVRLSGFTLQEARTVIAEHLKAAVGLANPRVNIAVVQTRSMQQIRGLHLVRQDGRVQLGVYGSVYIAGLTVDEAKAAVQNHLTQFLVKPEIALDVVGFNTKTFYVVLDGGGYGEQIYEFPITGNDTVLSALAKVQGLAPSSSKRHVWVARPAPAESDSDQVLPVDYVGVVQKGRTATNYQLFPGDRVYVKADGLVTVRNVLDKILTPVERMLGVTLLANAARHSFNSSGSSGSTGQ